MRRTHSMTDKGKEVRVELEAAKPRQKRSKTAVKDGTTVQMCTFQAHGFVASSMY